MIGNSYVIGMDPKNIKIQNKTTKEVTVLPYGLCVWAAGISPREVTKTMIKKMPIQNNRFLKTIFFYFSGKAYLY